MGHTTLDASSTEPILIGTDENRCFAIKYLINNYGPLKSALSELLESSSMKANDRLPISLGGYSMKILGANEHNVNPDGSVTACLDEGCQYKIRLKSHLPCRSTAVLTVDGNHVGNFRLNPYQCWDIERTAEQASRFTFYSVRNVMAAKEDTKR